MTDELQAEESGITLDSDLIENEEAETVTAEGGADLATATGEDQDKKEDDGVKKAINKQHAKFREEERKRFKVENEAKELREKLAAIEAEKGDVAIPPLPDPYDEDYEALMLARENAIIKKAGLDAQNNIAVEQRNKQQEAAEKADKDRLDEAVAEYGRRAIKSGLDMNDMRVAEQTVLDYGVSGEVIDFILQDEDGPVITKYLADNPLELDDLRSLQPMQAALKINSSIRASASMLKPQASNAPDPIETLDGRGVGEQDSKFIKGATFD